MPLTEPDSRHETPRPLFETDRPAHRTTNSHPARSNWGIALVAAAGSLLGNPAQATQTVAPEPVSPGAVERPTTIRTVCPTFTWGLPAGLESDAAELELVVYQVNGHGEQEFDLVGVLSESLPASARAWTPSSDRCLQPGSAYAWTIGAGEKGADKLWSQTALFGIADDDRLAPGETGLHALQSPLSAIHRSGAEMQSDSRDLGSSARQPGSAETTSKVVEPLIPAGASGLIAELADVTGVTFGVQGLSHSPEGFGVLGLNDNGGVGVAASGGIDLVLDGLPAAALTESSFHRTAAGDLAFDFSNTGAGDMTLRVDGTDVLTRDTTVVSGDPVAALTNNGAGRGLEISSDTNVGIDVVQAGTHGLLVRDAGDDGVRIGLAADGVQIDDAGAEGVFVKKAGANGVRVEQAGLPAKTIAALGSNGLQIEGAQDTGVVIGYAGQDGFVVSEVGTPAKVNGPPGVGIGFALDGAENVGMWIGYAGQAGINLEEIGDAGTLAPGIRVGSATGPGVVVEEAGIGLKIGSTDAQGILVSDSLDSGLEIVNTLGHGVHIGAALSDGLHVDQASLDGVHIEGASDDGIEVHSTGILGHGVHVAEAAEHGLFVADAGSDGLHIAGFDADNLGGVGIFVSNGDVTDKAAHFDGMVEVVGTLTKGSGTFKIDHPVDPENRYLSHSFVESPDMMNVYNGNVVLDRQGRARVTMPAWFEALNREFRYQLTAIGAPGPDLHVAREIEDNAFEIAGGEPDSKVSWQITGVRRDAYAEAHRTEVEAWKAPEDRGFYLHPAAFGLPPELGISQARLARRSVSDDPASGARERLAP